MFLRLDDKTGAAWAMNSLGHLVKDNEQDFEQAIALFEQSIAVAAELDSDRKLLMTNLTGLSLVGIQVGRYDYAREQIEKGLLVAREMNDRQSLAALLRYRGAAARMQRDYELATSSYLEALPFAREIHANNLVFGSLNGLGEIARDQKNYAQAITYYQAALAIMREWDPTRCNTMLANLGHAYIDNGNLENATATLIESLTILGKEPRPADVAWSAWGLAKVAIARVLPERAARLYGAAEGLLSKSGSTTDPLDRQEAERNISLLHSEMGADAFAVVWSEGQAMSLEASIAYALEEMEAKTLIAREPARA
jgi:tetratricopeptide (TPR) repeat protein